jgi:hypothetical protein
LTRLAIDLGGENVMRMALVVLVLASAPVLAQAPAPPVSTDTKTEAARAAEAAELARKAAEEFTITIGQPDRTITLQLEPKPLLQWSNPVAGSIHGSVFVWTARGRPEAISSIYKWYSPNHHLALEFHSLSSQPLTGTRVGRPTWIPARAGVELKPIPGAPEPAAMPAQRLRQLRALAKEFSASETTRTDVTRELRLLTQPIYRYASTDPDLLDGGLFTFVEGTDPEIILLIEARRGPKGFAWHYGLVRMNSLTLRVSHNGREVWNLPTIPWEQVHNPREPYSLFAFQPGEGVNPPGPGDPPPGK